MTQATETDCLYMRRALQLAARGRFFASPNPMVGAVIVHNGRIIGEGYHRRVGGPHAEVNAVNSVAPADRHLLTSATMYVTLEPCSHYGRTPPCSLLIIETGIPHVVVGMTDPFARVNGRGITMLREAGVDVTVGCLEQECRALNRRFITAHTLRRPLVTLKWAQSADACMGLTDRRAIFSTKRSAVAVHRLRALNDAIAAGARTIIADNPSLDTRLIDGRSPRVVILDRRGLIATTPPQLDREDTIVLGDEPLAEQMHRLYDQGITSLLVEGGRDVLQGFIDADIWDNARVEIATSLTLGGGDRAVKAPMIPLKPCKVEKIGSNIVLHFSNSSVK